LPHSSQRGWLSERLLAEHVKLSKSARVLVTSLGVGELGQRIRLEHPHADVVAFFLDAFLESKCRQNEIVTMCRSDLPDDTRDAVLIPVRQDGEAELVRDYLQQAFLCLREGGSLWTATDNPNDTWLGEQVKTLFGRVSRRALPEGVVYTSSRVGPLRRMRSFECEFTFRFRDRLLRVVTRPGVFSHRRVDPGTRAILKTFNVTDGERVMDIGCGSGVLSLAAASLTPQGGVWAIDSNHRAVECVQMAAQRNDLANIHAEVAFDGGSAERRVDVCLANPPYYAQFRIAELFLDAAKRALKPGGRLYLVTKFPQWYDENLLRWFQQAEIKAVGRYHVITARA